MEICTFAELIARRRDLEDMIQGAVRMRARAYAPYSGFKVGALIAVDNPAGSPHEARWYMGCNVENMIYMVTHAEQVAIARMIVELGVKPKPVIARVVVACVAAQPGKHALPCGLCRQWIAEFGTAQTEIIGVRLVESGAEVTDGGEIFGVAGVECATLGELLPYTFSM